MHPEVDPAVMSVKGCTKAFDPVRLQTPQQQHAGRNYVLPTIKFNSWKSDCARRQLEWNNANPTAWPRVSDLTKRCLIACPINDNPNHVCFLSANVLIQRLIFCALRKQSPAYIRNTEKIAFLPGWVTPIKKREGKKKDSQSQKRVIFLFTQSR